MKFWAGIFSICGINRNRANGPGPAITATTAPTLSALNENQTPADGYTAGAYVSSAGAIASEVVTYLVDGVSQSSGYDLQAGEVLQISVLVTDSASESRVFNTGSATVTAVVPVNLTPPVIGLANNSTPLLAVTPGNYSGNPVVAREIIIGTTAIQIALTWLVPPVHYGKNVVVKEYAVNSGNSGNPLETLSASFVIPNTPAALPGTSFSLSDGDGKTTLTVTTAAPDRGAPLLATFYIVDGGTPVDCGFIGTGSVDIPLANGSSYNIQAFNTNQMGQSVLSPVKVASPMAPPVSDVISPIVNAAAGPTTWSETDELADMWQDTAKTVPAVDGQPVAAISRTAGTMDMVQPTTGKRPTLDLATGLLQSNRATEATPRFVLSGGLANTYAAFIVKIDPANASNDRFILFGGQSGGFAFPAIKGNTSTSKGQNVGSPVLKIDGVIHAFTNRGALYSALADNQKHVVEIVGMTLTNALWSGEVFIGAYPGQNSFFSDMLSGDYVVAAAPSVAEQDVIRAELQARHGLGGSANSVFEPDVFETGVFQ